MLVRVTGGIGGMSVDDGSLDADEVGPTRRLPKPAPKSEATPLSSGCAVLNDESNSPEESSGPEVTVPSTADPVEILAEALLKDVAPPNRLPKLAPMFDIAETIAFWLLEAGSIRVEPGMTDDAETKFGGLLDGGMTVAVTVAGTVPDCPLADTGEETGVLEEELRPRMLGRLMLVASPINGVGVFCVIDATGDTEPAACDDGGSAVAIVCDDGLSAVAIVCSTEANGGDAARVVEAPTGNEVPVRTGTRAMIPFAPNSVPTVAVVPPTTCCTTPCVPLRAHFCTVLSYVAPTQYGLPTHESKHTARLGVTVAPKSVCTRFVLQMTWNTRPLLVIVVPLV
jgi:hypothetical protein